MYKLPNEGNLYLRIDSNGSKYWIFNYPRPYIDKRNDLSLGTYPEVTLEEAHIVRDEYKKLIKKGIDPATVRLVYQVKVSVFISTHHYLQSCNGCNGAGDKGGKLPWLEWEPKNPNPKVENLMKEAPIFLEMKFNR